MVKHWKEISKALKVIFTYNSSLKLQILIVNNNKKIILYILLIYMFRLHLQYTTKFDTKINTKLINLPVQTNNKLSWIV